MDATTELPIRLAVVLASRTMKEAPRAAGCPLGLLDSEGFIEGWLLSPEDGIGVLGVAAGRLPLPLPFLFFGHPPLFFTKEATTIG